MGPDVGFLTAPIEIHPVWPTIILAGIDRIYWTDDDFLTPHEVTGSLDGSAVVAIRVNPADPNRVYAAASYGGVFRSFDSGTVFSAFSDATGNLPNVRVTDLVWHAPSGTWTAATYGRGLWRVDSL